MLKTLRLLAVAAVVFFAANGVSLAKALKVGYVDIEKVFNEYHRTKAENVKLQGIQQAKKAEADRMIADINKLKEEAELLSADAKKSKEAVVRDKIGQLREYERDTIQEIREKLLSMRKELLDSITAVVEDKGKTDGYDFILLNDAVIYRESSLDLTEDMIKVLNKGQK
jgi:Skp family chaperone for outer membrane proteins